MSPSRAATSPSHRITVSPSHQPVVRCVDIHKSYTIGGRAVHALRGASLEIAEPGFYAIMGQSGSGKSTLLHLLAALDRPDSGTITVAGREVQGLGEREATEFRRRSVGIVFQQFNLIPTLTARENVELPGVLAGEGARWIAERSGELLERLGMSDRAAHRPDALSGGEQQRVAIARALFFAPPVVLADEPTGNLDSISSAKLWAVLADLAGSGESTVLVVTHEPAAAVNCRRIHVLSDGRFTGQIDTEGLDAGGVAARYQQLVRAA